MISTISGGPTLVGTSNNSIKHYVRSSYAHLVFSTEHGRLPKMPKSGWASITFSEEEERGVILPHGNPLIICANISNFDISRILVDTGSLVSVMFTDAFNELQPLEVSTSPSLSIQHLSEQRSLLPSSSLIVPQPTMSFLDTLPWHE
ncbi:unnamed protein product [Prunus armeniaca]